MGAVMAIFKLSNAAGFGLNMSNTDGDGFAVVSGGTGQVFYAGDTGSIVGFWVTGNPRLDYFEFSYLLSGQNVLIEDVDYWNNDILFASITDLDLHTTVQDLVAETVSVRLNAEADQFYTNDYNDFIRGGFGNDSIFAYAGNDTAYGDAGNDKIYAGNGNDKVYGGSGNDLLWGGLGADVLNGDAGSDVFVYNEVAESVPGKTHDTIVAFQPGVDIINLRTIDADTDGTKGNQSFTFIGGQKFHGVDGELRFANGLLQGDVDGDKRPDFEIVIGATKLVAADFVL
jgi:Ca2+-binding RTX toxin-like protein